MGEGFERHLQRFSLRKSHVRSAQGFDISQPLPILEAWEKRVCA